MLHPFALTTLAMLAFAGNSVLCRLALSTTPIDAATFTSVRVIAGAVTLVLLVTLRGRGWNDRSFINAGSWASAVALLIYAAGFSFAYLQLATGVGALILFGCVQITMIGSGYWQGERQNRRQVAGVALALAGLVALLLPGAAAPPIAAALLMAVSGAGWAIYSLRGRGQTDPVKTTAGNFVRATPMAMCLSLLFIDRMNVDPTGVMYAVVSGALTSGVGYAIWYAALPSLQATQAATVQLSVPLLAAIAGVLLLGEPLTLRLVLTSAAIVGGIALVYCNES